MYLCVSIIIIVKITLHYLFLDTGVLLHQVQSVFDPNNKKSNKKQSVFSLRTDEASASQYFQFYGFLSQQQNMMQVIMMVFCSQHHIECGCGLSTLVVCLSFILSAKINF